MTKILNETRRHGSLWSAASRGTDSFTFTPPEGEVFHSCRLTILDTRLDAHAQIKSQPAPGANGTLKTSVQWACRASGILEYQLEIFSQPATGTAASVTAQMTGFDPRVHGYHFINSFPPRPDILLKTPFGDIPIGDASKGLCGGMVYSSLDFFHAGIPVPPDKKPPDGGVLFDFIVGRLFNSFNLPLGVLKYIDLMSPNMPETESRGGRRGFAARGRAWRMIREEWPAIKKLLDAGQPCPLGLVRVKSTDYVKDLGQNHQVLTYGYDVIDDELRLFIYDPNYRDNNRITLNLKLSDPHGPAQVSYSTKEPLYSFFRTSYKFVMPPAAGAQSGRILLFDEKNFKGRAKDIFSASPDLGLIEDGFFNDRVSSFVILSGNWSFFRDPRFTTPYLRDGQPLVLGPGLYPRLDELGIEDNAISSLRVVSG